MTLIVLVIVLSTPIAEILSVSAVVLAIRSTDAEHATIIWRQTLDFFILDMGVILNSFSNS